MNYSDLQLRSKTFLDFTTDSKVIEEVLGASDKVSIEKFISRSQNIGVKAATFLEYAHLIGDEKFIEVIQAEFSDYFSFLIVD